MKSALHKIFLSYKIKMKRVLKIIKQLLMAVPLKKQFIQQIIE